MTSEEEILKQYDLDALNKLEDQESIELIMFVRIIQLVLKKRCEFHGIDMDEQGSFNKLIEIERKMKI